MDPQEYLHILFNKVLHLPEFLSLSLGQDDYFHQVLVTATPSDVDKKRIPSVQALLEQSFMGQKLKFKTIPSPALILQMPRSGNKYRTYDGILPNLTIDITDLLQDTPRMCAICGEFAAFECPDCYGSFSSVSQTTPSGLASDSTCFCTECVNRVHSKRERIGHKNISKMEFSFDPAPYFTGTGSRPVKAERSDLAFGFLPPFSSSSSKAASFKPHRIPRVTMDLFAVICIETSHFVSFVKCGPGREAPWVFFDSMADRIESSYDGSSQGQNIPNVKHLPKMGKWLDNLEKEPGGLFLETLGDFTAELKRLITDSYICLYYSPKASMYS
jgi:ubiquitin thioesterase CYLD